MTIGEPPQGTNYAELLKAGRTVEIPLGQNQTLHVSIAECWIEKRSELVLSQHQLDRLLDSTQRNGQLSLSWDSQQNPDDENSTFIAHDNGEGDTTGQVIDDGNRPNIYWALTERSAILFLGH